ncbi:MAG: hypothetical protein V4662_17275 [Verrucomicrobiota bacterium]
MLGEPIGMFDHFQPEPALCVDGEALPGWQGKAGPCALYIWRQHCAAPVDQAVDEGVRGKPEVMVASRLPEGEALIYTEHPRNGEMVYATILVRDGVWIETTLLDSGEGE